jgi:hypothetical protein
MILFQAGAERHVEIFQHDLRKLSASWPSGMTTPVSAGECAPCSWHWRFEAPHLGGGTASRRCGACGGEDVLQPFLLEPS